MRFKILAFILIVSLSGCMLSEGDCVYVTNEDGSITKGEYIKFSSGVHWYLKSGEVNTAEPYIQHVTECID